MRNIFFLAVFALTPANAKNLQELSYTTPPHQYTKMCGELPAMCDYNHSFGLSDILKKEHITIVNSQINQKYKPASDQEIYGQSDLWTIPIGRADCEDYVLAKKQELKKRGFPDKDLRIAIVEGQTEIFKHAVLLVTYQNQDYVLDNLTNDVKVWHKSGYKFLIKQSRSKLDKWVKV